MYLGLWSYAKRCLSFRYVFVILAASVTLSIQAQTFPSSTFTSISIGGKHGCGLTEMGGVKCWGDNQFGQLGVGDTKRYSVYPLDVVDLHTGVSAVTVGRDHSCALLSNSSVKCWGGNMGYQLGDSTTQTRYTPVAVVGLGENIVGIAANNMQSCALTDQGSVKCWGYHNLAYKTSPVNVPGFESGITSITAGAHHVCGVTPFATVKCMGNNTSGQVGDGTTTSRSVAVDIVGLESVSQIRAGSTHTCALTLLGNIYCWGNNTRGQLGDGTQIRKLSPTLISSDDYLFSSVTAGLSNSCGLGVDGGIQCWGANTSGQLGNNTKVDSPLATDVMGLNIGSTEVAVGDSFGCALNIEGELNCWGDNSYGKLADGSTTEKLLPSPINQSNTPEPINCQSLSFTIGGTVNGIWGQVGDCTAGVRGAAFKTDALSFWGVAGQLISIDATSTAFNTFLYLRDPLGRVIAYDDDGAYVPVSSSTPNSRIPAKWGSFVLPVTGTYTIEITSSTTTNANPYGSYRIVTRTYGFASSGSFSSGFSSQSSSASSVIVNSSSSSMSSSVNSSATASSLMSSSHSSSSSSVVSGNACDPVMVAFGSIHAGALASTDCRSGARGANYYVDRYSLAGVAGQQISIQLTSTAFDTYLYLKNSSGVVIAFNDDGGGGTNSRIPASAGTFTLPQTGSYILEVTSYSALKVGAYSLLVSTP